MDTIKWMENTISKDQIAILKLILLIIFTKIATTFCTHVIQQIADIIQDTKPFGKKRKTKNIDADFIYNLEECPICLELLCDPVRVQCGHVYCLQCLITYCEINANFRWKCPVCRNHIRAVHYLEQYNDSNLEEKERNMMLHNLRSLIIYSNSFYYSLMKKLLMVLKWSSYVILIGMAIVVIAYTKNFLDKLCDQGIRMEVNTLKA